MGHAVERLASWYLIPMLVHLVFSWQLPSLKAHIKQHWLQAGWVSSEAGNNTDVWPPVEDDLLHVVPQGEEKCASEERRNTMANIMKPPPEYSAPPIPGYAPPPVYSQPPRQSYRWVWIVLGVFVLLAIVGTALLALGVGFAVNTYGGPTIASDQYYTAIRNQNYARAYSYLGSELKTVYSQEAFTQAAMQRDATSGKVSHYAYTNVPLGDPATANLTITRVDGITYTVQLEMRLEGGAWKVTAFDRI